MILHVRQPNTATAERAWIVDVMLGQFLGLDYKIEFYDGRDTLISIASNELVMPDVFFSNAINCWGQADSCQMNTSLVFDTARLPFPTINTTSKIPVLFGGGELEISSGRITLPIDVFGCAFVLLSRYEEFVDARRDVHGRFAASFSQVGDFRFLKRPIVNEQLEVLWACLAFLCPHLERKRRAGKIEVSADVDIPYSPGNKSVKRLIRRLGGDVLRRRSLVDAGNSLLSFGLTKFGHYHRDPYYPWINWLLEANESLANRMTFYFIAERSAGDIDGVYDLEEPVIKGLLKRIIEGGHRIGLHPSYATFQNPTQLAREAERLQNIVEKIDPGFELSHCRQHFLRWSVHETPKHQNAVGLRFDSTLGYADCAGFRTGVCYEYPMFDLGRRKVLSIRQQPLVAMEVSVFGQGYMNVGSHQKALDILRELKHNCLLFGGDFRMLWHNNMLRDEADRALYLALIEKEE